MKEETVLQNKIRVALSSYGIVLRLNGGVFKTHDDRYIKIGAVGVPDLLFIGDGFIAFIEVKTPKGVVSKEQQNFINKVKILGHKAGVARSVADAVKIINN